MKKFIIILILSFFSITSLLAEIANNIKIQGNKRISSETIKVYGNIELGKNYNEVEINKILNNLYATEFFQDVKVSISNNELNIEVREYPFVDQLVVVGEAAKKYRDQIKKIIKTKEKRPFLKPNLSKDIELIKMLYSSAGYNSAKIEIKTKEVSNDQIDILIEVDRGEKTKISSINFIGNKKVSSRRLRDVIASRKINFGNLYQIKLTLVKIH